MRPPACFLFCLWLAGVGTALPAQSAQREWTGSASGFWSNPNNWDPAGIPQDGDTLRFGAFFNRSMVNDLPGLRLDALVFDHFDYVLSGNTLTLGMHVGDAVIDTPMGGGSGSATINCPLILGTNRCFFKCEPFREDGSATLRINADVNLNGYNLTLWSFPGGAGADAKIEIAGSISGNGDVTVTPADADRGKIEFIGSAENTFSGTLRVTSSGSEPDAGVYFKKQAGSVVTHRLELAEGVTVDVERPHQIGDNATVCITQGSRLLFHGNTETIGSLCLTNSAGDTEPSLVDTGGATLSVQGDITAVNNSLLVIPTIRGKLGLPGPLPQLRASSAPSEGARELAHPKSWRPFERTTSARSVLDCASPLALSAVDVDTYIAADSSAPAVDSISLQPLFWLTE